MKAQPAGAIDYTCPRCLVSGAIVDGRVTVPHDRACPNHPANRAARISLHSHATGGTR